MDLKTSGMTSFRTRITGVLIAALVVVWALALLEVDHAGEGHERLAENTCLFEARAFAHNIVTTVERADELLLDLRGNWIEHPQEFASLVRQREPHIADLSLQISVIDRNGNLAFSNLQPVHERVNLGDREHVRVQLDGHDDRLFISRPVFGKVSGRWTIQLTRPILDHGRVAGVIVVSIDPDALAHFNADLGLGEVATSTVANDQGIILARQPLPPGTLGRQLTGGPYGDPTAPNSGVFSRTAQVDGVERLYGYQRIPQYGLLVSVGHLQTELRAEVSRQHQVVLATAGAVSLLLLLVFLLLWRWQRERELALVAANASQRMLQSSIDTIGEAFAVYDEHDRLAYFNERYRALYARSATMIERGRSFEEIIRYGVQQGQYAQARGREEAWVAERLASHHSAHSDQLQQLDDGTWLRIRERKTPEGYVVGFRIDITALVESQHGAEDARLAAEAANRAKTEFLANVSHELRTPLNGIIGMSEVLSRGQLANDQREILGYLNTCSERLRALLSDLLDYASLESGEFGLQQRVFSPAALVQEVAREYKPRAEAKGLAFDCELAPDLPAAVHGDPQRLRQVLEQLVDNAVKFTDSGSVLLRCHLAGPGRGDTLRLGFTVRDTGAGIGQEDRGLMFQPFTQKDSSSSRRHGGTGLGLSLASGIAARMGGTITVESVQGYGSTFSFTVDVTQ